MGAKEDGLPARPGVARQQLFPHSKLPRTQPDGTSIPGEPASPVSQRLPPKVESLESLYFTPIPARGQPPLESSLDSLGDVFLDSGRKTRSARRRTTQIINITMTKVSRWPGRPRPLRAPFPRVPERQAALTARPRGWAAELPSRAAVQASRGKGQGSRPRAGCRRQCGAAAAQQGLPAPPAGCPGGLLARLGLRSSCPKEAGGAALLEEEGGGLRVGALALGLETRCCAPDELTRRGVPPQPRHCLAW